MSVCIVHKDGWAVTDSRESMCNTILPTTSIKAFIRHGYVVTMTGDAILSQHLQELADSTPEQEFFGAISNYFKEEDTQGTVLLVDRHRNLTLVDQNGFRSTVEEDFWAHGCAADFVLGALFQIAKDRAITSQDAVEAVAMAARYDSGIDDRAKVYRL